MRLFKPFQDLPIVDRAVQAFRFVTAILSILLMLVVILGPLLNKSNFYFARINCSHLDLANGLYNSLRSSVSLSPDYLDSSGAGEFSVDSSLTNSEITILTQYSEEQVSGAPQYTTNSLWKWCYGNYDTIETIGNGGKKTYTFTNQQLDCFTANTSAVFDYRAQLIDTGLESILAYAYEGNVMGPQYINEVHSRTKLYNLVKPAIYFALVSQLIVVIFAYVLYGNRGEMPVQLMNDNKRQNPNLNRVPKFLLHILAIITVASFASFTYGIAVMTHLIKGTQRDISNGMSDYGVNYAFGKVWFLIAWLAFGTLAFSMFSWAFPLWCANPSEEDILIEDDEAEYHFQTSRHHRAPPKKYVRQSSYGREMVNKRKSKGFRNILNGMATQPKGDKLMTSDRYNNDNNINDEDAASTIEWDNTAVEHGDAIELNDNLKLHSNEEELRKLGMSISRQSTVRHLNRNTSSKKKTGIVPSFTIQEVGEDNDSITPVEVGRSDSKHSQHYREETYDGYNKDHKGESIDRGQNPFVSVRNSADDSILNDAEMEFLDYNDYKV